MRCPYCAEDVRDEAVVCKHCHSELFVVKPLLSKINEMSARLAVFSEAAPNAESLVPNRAHHGAGRLHRPGCRRWIHRADLHRLGARAFSYHRLTGCFICVSYRYPVFFGLVCRDRKIPTCSPNCFGAWLCGDPIHGRRRVGSGQVPFLPKDAYEWRDFGYYSASIGFGFLTGAILRHMLIAIYAPSGKTNIVVEWIARFIVEQFTDGKPEFTLKAIRSMVSCLGFGSAIISLCRAWDS